MKEANTVPDSMRILILQDDTPAAALLVRHVVTRLDADITLVDTLADARDLLAARSFDAIIADRNLTDGDGLDLLAGDAISMPPLILLDDNPDAQRVLDAIRLGAADVLTAPLNHDYLIIAVHRVVDARRMNRREAARTKRLRRLSSRLIKDRRELRRRVDLICSDLVGAYQRLAEKVVAGPDGIPTAQAEAPDACFDGPDSHFEEDPV